jgi:hypothetical protein
MQSDLRWRKSSYSSNQGACVEVAQLPNGTVVRDSKDPDGPILRFSADVWRAFVREVKARSRPVGGRVR